jgi:hypothetical protein
VSSARQNANGNTDRVELPRVPSIPLSDEAAIEASRHQSIGELVRDATIQVSTLVRAEIELARSEVAREMKKGVTGSIFFIVALTILLLAFPFLFAAGALGVDNLIWDNHQPWLGFLIIFGLMIVLAIVFALLGVRKVKAIRAPERTISSMKDTAAALTSRGDHGPTDGHEVSTVPAS